MKTFLQSYDSLEYSSPEVTQRLRLFKVHRHHPAPCRVFIASLFFTSAFLLGANNLLFFSFSSLLLSSTVSYIKKIFFLVSRFSVLCFASHRKWESWDSIYDLNGRRSVNRSLVTEFVDILRSRKVVGSGRFLCSTLESY